ncbi:MAG: AAA family ATPase [Polyangiales bacterium]
MSQLDAPAAPPADDVPEPTANDVTLVQTLLKAREALETRLRRVIVGQQETIELLLIALLAQGHGLFVGVPGLAKTLLIRSLAAALSLDFQRIQFTPDLMPSDITGTEVLEEDPKTGERRFRFVPGPVFAHLLLADEINRTPPKTQSALLQAMAERRVSVGGHTYALEAPYLVFATQNPIEQEGTYPLPEAQLDRFLLQVQMDYPSYDEELEIVRRGQPHEASLPEAPHTDTPSAASPVLQRDTLQALQALVTRVPMADHVLRHAVDIVRATRPNPERSDAPDADVIDRYLAFGAGPRAAQALATAAKARAVLRGQCAAELDDVQALALPVLRHRLVRNFRGDAEGITDDALLQDALQRALSAQR